MRDYSGTPSYDHPVYATISLSRPHSFDPNVKITESFYCFEDHICSNPELNFFQSCYWIYNLTQSLFSSYF